MGTERGGVKLLRAIQKMCILVQCICNANCIVLQAVSRRGPALRRAARLRANYAMHSAAKPTSSRCLYTQFKQKITRFF